MRKLLIALLICAGLFGLVALGGYFYPRQVAISRSLVIEAPRWAIYEEIKDLRRFENWSPWAELDPQAQIEFEGDVGPGQVFRWKSEKREVGAGALQVVYLKEDEIVELNLYLDQESSEWCRVSLVLKLVPEGTEITWKLNGDTGINPLMRYVFHFMVREELEGQYEKGLDKLKRLVEAKARPLVEITPKKVEDFRYFATLPRETTESKLSDDMGESFPYLYEKGFPTLRNKRGRRFQHKDLPSMTIYLSYEEAEQPSYVDPKITYQAALEIPSDARIYPPNPEEFVSDKIKGGRYLIGIHKGSYDGLKNSHKEIAEYLDRNALKLNGPVIEKYVVSMWDTDDETSYETQIFYPVVQR
ncbi:MAG: GyrI-like domain-containing protein [Cytophagales bacterium]|nr:GyrI-like domain-containing protein [Cytophagales bacterium]